MNRFLNFSRSSRRQPSASNKQAGLSLLQMLGVLMLVGIVAAVLLKQWA